MLRSVTKQKKETNGKHILDSRVSRNNLDCGNNNESMKTIAIILIMAWTTIQLVHSQTNDGATATNPMYVAIVSTPESLEQSRSTMIHGVMYGGAFAVLLAGIIAVNRVWKTFLGGDRNDD